MPPSPPPTGADAPTATSPSARRVALVPPTAPSRSPRPPLELATLVDIAVGFAAAEALWRPPLELATLVDIAVGFAAAEALWRPHVDHDPLSRTSVRLAATEVYEVWLLGWTTDQGVDLHDHGASNAAFVVVEGTLDEITLHPGGRRTERLATGDVGTVAAGAVHDVVNRAPMEATSVHVYADPLRSMTYYDGDGRPRFTELVEQVPALLTSAAVARSLHPADR